MNDSAPILEFDCRAAYRSWLAENQASENGIWLLFTKGSKAFTAAEALEEALCFGWIDGLMKSIDEKTYKKYFSRRKDVKNWSDKNITIFERLVKSGLMTGHGLEVFKADKKAAKTDPAPSEKIAVLEAVLKDDEELLRLFKSTPASRQKQLAGFYCEAKTDATRAKRREKISATLRDNYGGMLY